MKANKKKLELAMARVCMNPSDLVLATKMSESAVKSVLGGRSVRPATLGRVAKALEIDPGELLEPEITPSHGRQEGRLCNC